MALTVKNRVGKAVLVMGSAAALAVGVAGSASAGILQPINQDASAFQTKYAPYFDYDADGCYPATAVDDNGKLNGGLETTGSTGGGCKSNHLGQANDYVRSACDANWCAYVYALYFEKDQGTGGLTGHRHDWESVVVWQKRGAETPSYVSASAHGKYETKAFSAVPHDGNHVKIVYHLGGATTHSFRFAKSGEVPEAWGNKQWDQPDLISMDRMKAKHSRAFNAIWNFDWSGVDAGQGATGANFPLQDFGNHYNNSLNHARPSAISSFNPNTSF